MQNFSTIAATPATPLPDGAVLDVDVTADWLQGRVAFGGLQGALGALAMRAAVGDALPLRALQMTFVSAVDPGPARAEATLLRRGRAVVHAQCRIVSGGRTAGVLVGLYGAPRTGSKARVDMPMPETVRRFEALRDAPFLEGVMPGFLSHYRMRWAGGTRLYSGEPPKPAEVWAPRREAGPDDGSAPPAALLGSIAAREASLVAMADLPPSPALSMLTERAPGASLTWLLEPLADARAFDPRGWSLLRTETRHAADGYTSQTARLWDASGRPLAVSHQTTAIFD